MIALTLAQGAAAADSLWVEVRNTMVLEHRLDVKRVRQEIAWLRNNPDFLRRLEPRLQRYGAYIFNEIRRRNMPAELLFLPVIESALDPYAFSPGGAAGLWQFMPATGKRFGLKIDWWADERRDPVLSTTAGLDYLENLHHRFDDWYLAVAAYNSGEGRINRALRKSDSRNFFDLKLPRETVGYVPRLLAFAAAFKAPEKFDLALPQVSMAIPFTRLQLGSQFDLARAAKTLDVSVDQIYSWNPALDQWATHPLGPHRLLVVDTELAAPGEAQSRIDNIAPEQRLTWRRYQIQQGDTLSELALRFVIDTRSLKRANAIEGDRIRAGASLLVPTSAHRAQAMPARRRARGKKIYRVKQGDSLWRIGKIFAVSHTTLMQLNQLSATAYLQPGQRLIVPLPAASPAGSAGD